VPEGRIRTYTVTTTKESLAALMAADSPKSLPETGGVLFLSFAVIVILGGPVFISGIGLKASCWRRRKGG
jgi:hypothetical protein